MSFASDVKNEVARLDSEAKDKKRFDYLCKRIKELDPYATI